MRELHLLSIVLLAASSSMDNFGVGLAYGLRNICLPLSLNLCIALANCFVTFVSMFFGEAISGLLPALMANYLGASLLIAIGCVIIIHEYRKRRWEETQKPDGPFKRTGGAEQDLRSRMLAVLDDPFAAGIPCLERITARDGALLAAALSLSNISSGIGAGMMGFSPLVTTAAVFVCSVLAVSIGMRTGHYTGVFIVKRLSEMLSGLLLVFIGIYEILF